MNEKIKPIISEFVYGTVTHIKLNGDNFLLWK